MERVMVMCLLSHLQETRFSLCHKNQQHCTQHLHLPDICWFDHLGLFVFTQDLIQLHQHERLSAPLDLMRQ